MPAVTYPSPAPRSSRRLPTRNGAIASASDLAWRRSRVWSNRAIIVYDPPFATARSSRASRLSLRCQSAGLRHKAFQGLVDEPADFLCIQNWAWQAQTVEERTGSTVIEMDILSEIFAIRRLQTSHLAFQRRRLRQRSAAGIDD